MVVSIDAILKSKGARGNVAPRQQLQVLRALSRVAQREKMNITAVVAGKPLNKAPHNKKLDGVRVRYAKTADKVGAQLIKSLKQAGSAGVLVTEDVALEKKALRRGTDTLRISTFRKLLDDGGDTGGGQGGGQGGGNRDRNNNGGRNSNRRDRDRGPRPERKKQRQPKPEKRNEEQDEISQMIDLVD
ncbi:MAG: hypothetical protein ISR84_02985 [Kiritimatiellales bacterium]|nr:hypothetical protein [Kiritimatiellales bacterium]